MAMFEDEYEFDYDRVIEDTDELYDLEDEYDYDTEYSDYECWDSYYHNVADELDDE